MRKLLFALFTISFLLTSCGGDDNDSPLQLEAKSAQVQSAEKYQIKATTTNSTQITYQSSNNFLATVSSTGEINAKRVGEVVITVSDGENTEHFKLTVKGRHNLYTEPNVDFKYKQAEFIKKHGTPVQTDDNSIAYTNSQKDPQYYTRYFFHETSLKHYISAIYIYSGDEEAIRSFLKERYLFLEINDTGDVYVNNTTPETSNLVIIVLKTKDNDGKTIYIVTYQPLDTSAEKLKSSKLNTSDIDKISKEASLFIK